MSSVGRPVPRLDGRAKVTGEATYAAEAPMNGAAFAVIVSSTIAKGRITKIDTEEALAAPGVIAIITPDNMPKLEPGQGMILEKRTALADYRIYYAGQHVAVVVGDTPERARYAANLIQIEYEAEEPVVDMHDPRSRTERPEKNFGEDLNTKKGDVEQALARPDVKVVRSTYAIPVETHNPIEPSATTAAWVGGELTAWHATQAISGNQNLLAANFGIDAANVRVLCPYTGGGFGCKNAWTHLSLAAAVARAAERPVRQVFNRKQMFTSCGHRPATEQTVTLAADAKGRLAAIRHEVAMQGCDLGMFIESCAMGTSRMLYDTETYQDSHIVKMVDLSPGGFMRAPGESTGTFALESAMDELAVELGLDPVELRLRNYADKDPRNGKPWSSKHLRECYEMGMEKFGWSRRDPRPGSMRSAGGRLLGWGMATATYPAFKFATSAQIRLVLDNGNIRAEAASATHDLGTGTWTIGAQMTAEITGLPLERVSFELGDSRLPPAGISAGSSTAGSMIAALSLAAGKVIESLLDLAGASSPLAGLSSSELVLQGDRLVAKGSAERFEDLPSLLTRLGKSEVEGIAREEGEDDKNYSFSSFGAHFVEVEIQEPAPRVQVKRVVSVIDAGRVLNPRTARSQILGGVTMGIGMALMEETLYDLRTGRPMTDNLADYRVPVNPDVRDLEVHFVEQPDMLFNALGARGIGEIGITGVAAAIANAVYHATGKRVRDLPITPDKLL